MTLQLLLKCCMNGFDKRKLIKAKGIVDAVFRLLVFVLLMLISIENT